MTRIVTVLCGILLAGCQQPIMSTTTTAAPIGNVENGNAASEAFLAQQLAALKPGSQCTVTLTDSDWEYTREVTGTVASAAEGGVVLSDAEEIITGRAASGVPMNNIPYVNRLFKNTGVGVVRKPLGTHTLTAKQIQDVQSDE